MSHHDPNPMPEKQEHTMRYFIDYELNPVLVRFPCYVCGGHTDRQDPIAFAYDEDGGPNAYVCDECCALTPAGRSQRLLAQAAILRKLADSLTVDASAEWVLRTPQDQARSHCRSCGQPTMPSAWVEDDDPTLTITGWVHVTDSTTEEDCDATRPVAAS